MYVYGVLSHLKGAPSAGDSSVFFYMDDQSISNFTFKPDGVGSFTYNVLLLSVDNLTYASHHLVFENGYIGGPTSLLLFDYLVYTTTWVTFYHRM